MKTGLTAEIKNIFKQGNNFRVLIFVNLAVFVLIQFVMLAFWLTKKPIDITSWIGVPSNFQILIRHPWTIITYMFVHTGFLHLFFNLLAFYWFGKLFLDYLSQRQLLGLYILGGLLGALFFIAAYNLIPAFSDMKYAATAIGASASIMAVVFAIAVLVPNHEIYLLFFGRIKLKYLAIAFVLIDLLSIPLGNAGGHIAHLGGACMGFIFTKMYIKGTDITIYVSRLLFFFKKLFLPQEKIKVTYRNPNKTYSKPETDFEYNERKNREQKEIDVILDKVAKSGYSSLSKDEKEKLFRSSKN